jgi:hypothetical protein
MAFTPEERKARAKARSAAWYLANRDRCRELNKARRLALKEQIAAEKRKYYLANKERILARQKARSKDPEVKARIKEYVRSVSPLRATEKRQRHQADPRKRILLSARKRHAKRFSGDCNLTIDDIVIPDVCPVLGLPLTVVGYKRSPNSPTLDRIDNSKGYVRGNIRVISWRANNLKSDATLGEALAIYEYMLNELQTTITDLQSKAAP